MGEQFEYISNRLGIRLIDENRTVLKSVGSPFHYEDQMKIFTFHRENYQQLTYNTVTRIIDTIARENRRNMLVLFTSFSALKDIYKQLTTSIKGSDVKLLAQGFGGSRTALLKEFSRSENAVLLGTVSFWEGVDIVGKGLEVLIITKLPFAVPSEPIIEANMEKINAENGNAFVNYYVPDAVLKTRQGIGRLIRSASDAGVVINLDNRTDTKFYGKMFKRSMPVEPQTVVGEEELFRQVRQFFKNQKV